MAIFSVMDEHLREPRGVPTEGRLVLSTLRPGSSVIGAHAPSLKLVIDGEEVYEVGGRSVRIRPGEYLYLGPGEACVGTNKQHTTGLCLLMPPGAPVPEEAKADPLDPVLGRALVLPTSTSAMGRKLRAVALRIAKDPALGTRIAPLLVSAAADAMCEPLRSSRIAMSALSAAKASTRRQLYQRLERARGYLHDRPGRPVTLAELSGVANLSQFHLARFFKMAFGKSPIAYHRDIRLGLAVQLLRNGDPLLSDIAARTGYSDEVAFSHAFRRRFGRAPKAWAAAEAAHAGRGSGQ